MMSSVTALGSTEATNNFQIENSHPTTKVPVINKMENQIDMPSNIVSNFQTSNTAAPHIKTQVLPVVYIQTPTKLPFVSINSTHNNNVLVTSGQQFQFTNFTSNLASKAQISNISVSTSQNVVLSNTAAKPQQIVIQKAGGNVQIPAKLTGAYLTMLKPLAKLGETTNTSNQIHLASTTASNNSTIFQTSNTNQKYVITPMPTIATNRLATTVTTNSVHTKIALMPLSIQPSTNDALGKYKFVNIKIADGQLQTENSSITVMCDSNNSNGGHPTENKLMCHEIIDLDSPVKEDNSESESISATASKMEYPTINPLVESIICKPKEMPKYTKHGISILKKNYSFSERRPETFSNNIVIHPNFISDVSTKHDVVVTKPSTGTEETIILSEPKITTCTQKSGRRKSIFSCRKDYDETPFQFFDSAEKFNPTDLKKSFDNSDISFTKLVNTEPLDTTKIKEEPDYVEIEVIKEKSDINMNDECDLQKVLKWEGGVGSLPGSDIKFIVNEFNMVEYVTQDEYSKMVEKKEPKPKDRVREEFQEEMRCVECGCFGLPSDFISPKYCSHDCQEAGRYRLAKEKEVKLKRKRKVSSKKQEISSDSCKIEKEQSASEEENSLNDNSQDKYSYPWTCAKKGFSWSKYLEHIKAKPAPVKLFKEPFPYNRNGFRPGMKLEGIDPHHPSYYCVLSVAELHGYRMRLHFDGYPDSYDFWINADSMNIFPMGWCEKYGHVLQPPPGYDVDTFNWVHYLKQTKSAAAPKHLFANRAGNAICPNGFRVGMKLEAVDRTNTSLVCVATIRDMMDNRILVHFDSWDDIYDYWADPTSPYIHPVGWCDQYGHNLTPPNDYPNPSEFTWTSFLKETKTVAAPVRAFKQRPACGFKCGMRLECVDKRVPQLIRVATVDEVKDHQIKVHFDGWLDKYSYWVEDDCPNIHPVGWCQKTGHSIESPLTPDDVYDFLECPTIGCRGQGHIEGAKYATHSNQKYCPYADENLCAEKALPDRLLSPDRAIESVVPVSREPKEIKPKPRIGRPPKYPRLESIKVEEEDDESDEVIVKPKRKYQKRIKEEPIADLEEKFMDFLKEAQITPAENESWYRHSKFLTNFTEFKADPRYWNELQVANFVGALPTGGRDHAETFRYNEIDGEALLLLTQKDIIDILQIKVGPAIKLYNSIVLLRKNVIKKHFSFK